MLEEKREKDNVSIEKLDDQFKRTIGRGESEDNNDSNIY